MSPQPSSPAEVPSQTAAVARAAFPWGNAYMRLRDGLGTVFTDAQVTAVFSSRGRPAEAPWRLARVAVLQFAENLSDRRAAEVARGRIEVLGQALAQGDAIKIEGEALLTLARGEGAEVLVFDLAA